MDLLSNIFVLKLGCALIKNNFHYCCACESNGLIKIYCFQSYPNYVLIYFKQKTKLVPVEYARLPIKSITMTGEKIS